MSMARTRVRPSRSKQEVFTVVYYGDRNRFVLTEDIKAYGYDDAAYRAGLSMPPGAVRFKVIDQALEVYAVTANVTETLRRLIKERGAASGE